MCEVCVGSELTHNSSDDHFAAEADGGFFDTEVTLRVDTGPAPILTTSGATAVAGRAVMFADPDKIVVPLLLNGAADVAVSSNGP